MLCLCFWGFVSPAYSQIGTWKSFTSMKSVRSAVRLGSNVWAATGGGVFAYDTATTSYVKYTNADGLTSNDLCAIGSDADGRIWVGASDGSINVYNGTSKSWTAVKDIYESGSYTTKTIHGFFAKGDSVFVVSDFGVSVFRLSQWDIGDTYYAHFGSSTPSVSCAVLQGHKLWIGTSSGVAMDIFGSSSSVLYASLGSLMTAAVNTMTVFHDTLIVGTSAGAVYFDGTTFQTIFALSGQNIIDFQCDTTNNRLEALVAGDGIKVFSSVSGSPTNIYASYSSTVSAFVQNDFSRIATDGKGIAEWKNNAWSQRVPNGPNSSMFNSLFVDGNGVLWCTGGEQAHSGFYRYNPALTDTLRWKNFTSDNNPLMYYHGGAFNDCHKVSQGLNGSVWVSTWGNGFLVVESDSITKRVDHYTITPGLTGALADHPDYVVGSGTAIDSKGMLWLGLYNVSNGRSLTRMNTDTTDTVFINTSVAANFVDITNDQYDTKWMSCTLPWHLNEIGLYYFNENFDESSRWRSVSGLPDTKIYCTTLDQNGSLWIGTGKGIVILNDPQYPDVQTTPSYFYYEVVQGIAVDGVNNKWLATKEGVFEVNSDGTEIIQHYTVGSTNGKLLSDDVWGIAIDQQRGIAYFATQAGLSSLQIGTTMPSNTMSSLLIYPNPYKIPNDLSLSIKGLVANSTIKILTVSGTLVNEFTVQGGGLALWDGKNKRGTYVPSGVYWIIGHANNGEEVATGKVAVIRH
jgi:ligand-binding sensor domain-containing protein